MSPEKFLNLARRVSKNPLVGPSRDFEYSTLAVCYSYPSIIDEVTLVDLSFTV